MNEVINILMLEHDPADIELLQYEIKRSGLPHTTRVVHTQEDFTAALQEYTPTIILSDFNLPGFNALEAFALRQQLAPDTPFLVVSGTVGEENAVSLIRSGITDYVLKDKLFTIGPKIERALQEYRERLEKREAQKQLKEYSERLTDILESIGDGFFALDENWTVTYWNLAAEKILGLPRKEMVGRNFWDWFAVDRSQHFYREFHRAAQERTVVCFEHFSPHWNYWLEVTAYPAPHGLSVYFKNITEKKDQEKKLQQAIDKYNTLSVATNNVVWDWDIRTGDIFWSKGLNATFGYSDEEIRNNLKWWEEKVHPADRERVSKKLHRQLDKHLHDWQDEYRFRCADGTYKNVLDKGFILFENNGHPYRMIGSMIDVTEQKELEQTLLNERVAHQKLLARATIEGQEKERAEIGKELHDNINQILTTVKLYLELSLSSPCQDRELLNRSVHNLQLCINEIRKVSKSLVAPNIREMGIVDALTELVESIKVLQLFKIEFSHSGPLQELDIQQQLAVYRIAQEQLNNIIKHAGASQVAVELHRQGCLVHLQMRDNGKGFDPKEKSKGIGLMNIQSRVELMNGSVEIVSSPGAGCLLKVLLPIKCQEEPGS
ncbi:PAS domain S-box protein [Paraflavisolibacter sp. H34]|uniref:hybrid sensor histidine kinase/response regulator n=1 Tax=Huijunlia imazamoxiresistens TaxID=3127457 RepID=UPI003016008C